MKSTISRAGLVLATTLLMLFGTLNAALAWTLSGTVYGGSNPLPDTKVTAFNASDQTEAGSCTTDASGHYSISVNNGTFNLLIAPPVTSELANSVVNGVPVVDADVTQNVVLVQQAVILSGVLRLSDGTLLKGIQVTIKDQFSGAQVGQIITGDDGKYSFPVSPGTYKLDLYGHRANGMNFLGAPYYFFLQPVVANLNVTSNTINDVILPFVTVSGKTTDSNGVSVAGVELHQDATGWYDYSITPNVWHYTEYSSEAIKSDESGNYKMLMFAHTHNITAIPPSGSNLAQTVFSSISIAGDTTRNFALNTAITVSGLLRLSDGTLLKGIQVTIKDQFSGAQVGQIITGDDGKYSFPVSPGTYKLDLYGHRANGMNFLGAPYYFFLQPVVANLNVTSNTINDVILPFVTVSGKTTDSNGVSVAGVELHQDATGWYDYSITPNVWHYTEYSSEAIKSDESGNYKMLMFAHTNSITVLPPTNSGFAQTPINGINVTQNILQNIILSMPDTSAPIILSGPKVSSFTDTTATIEWQTNESAKGGVVYGTGNPLDTTASEAEFKTIHSLPLTGLNPNTTYYIQVTATDASNNGPTTSQIISFTTKPTPDITPPVILTGPTITNITDTSAVIEWTTNEPSTGSIIYGLDSIPGQTIPDATLSTSHRITLTGLAPETVYYLKSTATDVANNGPTSTPIISFRTVATPDTTAPVIVEGPMAINISDSSATVVWTTDEPATSGVSWNDGTAYNLVTDETLSTNHSVRLTGLTGNTTYNFTVSSKDAAGNGPTLSATKTFVSLPAADTRPPVITLQPIVKNVNHQMALIYWETDEPADSVIEYGVTESFGTIDAKAELLTKHNRPLTGLQSGTTYYFRVLVSDASDNGPAASQVFSFTTDASPGTKAPVITTAPAIINTTDTGGTVYFETDVPCDTVVEYGAGSTITNQQSNGEKVNKHQTTITNLDANTSYSVQVSCTDMAGNTVVAKAGTPSTFLALNMVNLLSDAFVQASGSTGFMTQSLPDKTAPVITVAPAASSINSTQATIIWITDEIADSQVKFTIDGQALELTAGDITQVFNHSIVLTNLEPGATYKFKVVSVDPSGNPVTSGTYSFTTPLKVNGACGTSNNGTFVNAPTASICSTGTASSVSGAGPWNWTCSGSGGGVDAPCSANIQTYPLSLSLIGSGQVNGDLSCDSSGTCPQQQVNAGKSVNLIAATTFDTTFGGWAGCTSTNGTSCFITMNSARSITATFITAPVAINQRTGIGFSLLQNACTAAANNDTIKTRVSTAPLGGGLDVKSPNVTIFLNGGFDAAFGSAVGGYTTLQGPVTVSSGSVVVDHLIIM